ncbi:MAG: hypothetical protein ACLQPD_27055 [Desulfomonilaceae bacterium]
MGTNGFREDELITRKVNGQSRVFPVVGGRLRLAHEENQNLNLQTEMVSWDGQYAIFKCSAATSKGQFVGYGTANSQRDARLAESLIELAETRSVARALRFAGFGLEFVSAEEVSHVAPAESESQQSSNKPAASVFYEANGAGKDGAKPEALHCATAEKSKPSTGGNGRATQAQCRALYALTKRANYTDEDIGSMLSPLNASTFQDLTRESASHLITTLQTEAAA